MENLPLPAVQDKDTEHIQVLSVQCLGSRIQFPVFCIDLRVLFGVNLRHMGIQPDTGRQALHRLPDDRSYQVRILLQFIIDRLALGNSYIKIAFSIQIVYLQPSGCRHFPVYGCCAEHHIAHFMDKLKRRVFYFFIGTFLRQPQSRSRIKI